MQCHTLQSTFLPWLTQPALSLYDWQLFQYIFKGVVKYSTDLAQEHGVIPVSNCRLIARIPLYLK